MSKSHYLPNDDNGKGAWLNNLALQLPGVQPALTGITTLDVATVVADAAFFSYVLKTQEQVATYARQWTAYKNAARNGSGTNLGALPVITAELDAGAVLIGWLKHGMDGLEISVDRGDGKGSVFLAIHTVPGYTDTAALLAAGAVWKYKAIYLQADERVGQWSDMVSKAVAG
jgi:hypothetical protein